MAPGAVPILPGWATGEKTLRESYVRDEDERPKVAYNEFSDEIPVISLQGIDDEGDGGGRRAEICRRIVAAFEDWGIFQVVDHGVDTGLVDEMTRLAREFFALPQAEKLRFDMSGGKKGGFIVSSHLQGEAVQDWREIFTYFSYPIRSRDYSRWPEKPEGWRPVVEEYSSKLMELACKILGVLSEAMNLARDALAQACVDMDQKLVINFYPKCPQPDRTLGLKRHTDPGTITLLLQDHVGGLQATKDGGNTWITVQPVPGAFVVNLGDHGHYLSNGRFKNADHQAVVNANSTRMSIATFQNPAPQAVVYPLTVREGESPVMEAPITFAEMYRRKMSRDLELAKLKRETKQSAAAVVAAETNKKVEANGAVETKAL